MLLRVASCVLWVENLKTLFYELLVAFFLQLHLIGWTLPPIEILSLPHAIIIFMDHNDHLVPFKVWVIKSKL